MTERENEGEYGAALSPAESTSAPDDEEFAESAGWKEDGLRRLLLVSIPEGVVGVPADPVVEILPALLYARLPGAPAAVCGLANRRGRMLTVVDLGSALGGQAAADDREHRVVVVEYGGREVGLAVSDVLQIASDWWTGEAEAEVEEGEADGARTGSDERLRIVELEELLAPLFGTGDQGVGEPTTERS